MTRKVRPRQIWKPPSAADHNAMAAAADAYRAGPDDIPLPARPINDSVVTVRNDSGAAQRRGDVLGLSTANTKLLTDTYREQMWMIADKLSNCSRNCQVVICLDPIPIAGFGLAQIMGAGVAFVTVGAVWHRRAYPVYGTDKLASGLFGPLEILRTPTTTGELLCYVRMGHADTRGMFAKTTSSVSAATLTSGRLTLGSGTATIYDPYISAATQYADASHSLTIYNVGGSIITNGKWVQLIPADDWLPIVGIELCTAPV